MEIRTIIAYLILASMALAAVAGIAYVRRNTARRRHRRDRSRTAQQWRSDDSTETAPRSGGV